MLTVSWRVSLLRQITPGSSAGHSRGCLRRRTRGRRHGPPRSGWVADQTVTSLPQPWSVLAG